MKQEKTEIQKAWTEIRQKGKDAILNKAAEKYGNKTHAIRINWVYNDMIPEDNRKWFTDTVLEELNNQQAFDKLKEDFQNSALDSKTSEMLRNQIASIKGFD